MAALLAYLATVLISVVVLIVDALTRGFFGRLLLSIFFLLPPFPVIPATIVSILLLYGLTSSAFGWAVRLSRRYDESGGRIVGWLEQFLWLERAVARDDGHWPLYLAAIVAVISGIALLAVPSGIFPPEFWSFYALGGLTLARLYFDREKAQRAVQPAPPAPDLVVPGLQPIHATKVLEYLQARKYVQAAIRATKTFPAQQGPPGQALPAGGWADDLEPGGLLYAILAAVGIPGPERLYPHQLRILGAFLPTAQAQPRAHMVIATGPGSGRRLTLFLLAIERTLRRGAHVLIIAPDDQALEREREHFHDLANATDWRYALFEDIATPELMHPVPDPPPEVLFCTLDTLHRLLLPRHQEWDEFFAGLDLLVVHEIDRYSGIVGANAAQVFRRLNLVAAAHGQRPQYVATARATANLDGFAADLFGLSGAQNPLRVELGDGGARPEQLVALWHPARSVADTPGLARITQSRQAALDGLVNIAASLLDGPTVDGGERLLEYRLAIHLHDATTVEPERLRNEIAAHVGPAALQRLRITLDEAALRDGQEQDDCLLIFGTPPTLAEVRQLVGRVGAERLSGLAIVFAGDSPAALRLAAQLAPQPESAASSRNLAPLVSLSIQHPLVLRKHLQCVLAELRLTPDQVATTFGHVGRAIVDAWLHDGQLVLIEELDVRRPDDPVARRLLPRNAGTPHQDCPLDTVGTSEALLTVQSVADARIVLRVDHNRAPFELFPGRIFAGEQSPMLLSPAQGNDRYQAQRTPGTRVSTVPLYRVTAGAGAGQALVVTTSYLGDGDPVGFLRGPLPVQHELVAVRHADGLGGAAVPAVTTTRLDADAVLITGAGHASWSSRVAHSLAHLCNHALRTLLPPTVCHTELQVVAIPGLEANMIAGDRPVAGDLGDTGAAVLIYDSVDQGIGLAATIQPHLRQLLVEAYRILTGCPCQHGCPNCLLDPECRMHTPDFSCHDELDKAETLSFLGAILGSLVAAPVTGAWPTTPARATPAKEDDAHGAALSSPTH